MAKHLPHYFGEALARHPTHPFIVVPDRLHGPRPDLGGEVEEAKVEVQGTFGHVTAPAHKHGVLDRVRA